MTCLHCHATVTNGLALCELCQRKGKLILEFLPVYIRNLSRWKPGRAGSRPVPGSRIPAGAFGSGPGEDKVIRALDEACNALTTWARMLVEDRPHFPRPLTFADAVLTGDLPEATAEALSDDPGLLAQWLCIGFESHLTSIATLAWCGDFVREMGEHEQTLRGLTEQVAPGWYAGACRRCKTPTHVIPGLTWVTCDGCGATTYARDHLDTILDEARGWIAPPMRMAEALVALVDTERSPTRLHKRIVKWGDRGKISVLRKIDCDGDEVGPRQYRLGDVLDRLRSEGETRTSDKSAEVSSAS